MGPALFVSCVFAGHVALWIAILNRIHGLPIPRWIIHTVEKIIFVIAIGVPCLVAWLEFESLAPIREWTISGAVPLLTAYAGACLLIWLVIVPTWLWRYWLKPLPACLLSNDTECIDVSDRIPRSLVGSLKTRLLAYVPGNQMLHLNVHRKTIVLPQLPMSFSGLTIAHLSDLHFTGAIRQEYFDELVDQTNALDPDIIALTGDIIDKERCFDWIAQVLGRLRARQGKYFILGNHDQRIRDTGRIRRAITACGFTDLAGRWHRHETKEAAMLMAGNEEPWFRGLPDLREAPPSLANGGEFRLALAHSPDQISWARANHFDLMLAGHTHGGQIRFPLIGPVVSPSLYGVKYASGLFLEPPTLMHVSRGISGVDPIRINCAPELALLVLLGAQRLQER